VSVEDTTAALGALASGHRRSFRGPVVAITGSNGKTTTKEMCAAILSESGPCLKNRGNLNNQFGLPLTLLTREQEHRTMVVEIGMNHRGEIAPLAAIARPTVAVITNVGTAHIEFLGSRDEIALEKGDLIANLDEEAVAVLNADDHRVMAQAKRTRARIFRFGQHEEAEVRAERITSLGERGFAFDLVTQDARVPVHVGGLGEPTVSNALAATAASLAAGASLEDAAKGLARYRPMSGRMERVSLPRNIILINDTYNANPQSMEVALRSLAELKGESRGVAVLGDMGELGGSASQAHRATGALVAELGLDFLFTLGRFASETAGGASDAGMDPHRIHVGKSHDAMRLELRQILQGNDWVLVKGSRSMQMERVVDALTHDGETQ
jgi:UDP-N-acetylmuramoyl-tripeptide--D-alanyl-D-alanine ligase